MMDITVSYTKYKFLGNDFLTWLLFSIENDETYLEKIDKKNKSLLEIGNRIVMENTKNDIKKTIIVKSNKVNLEEVMTALRIGAFVSEIGLVYTYDNNIWKFTLKGENLNLNSLRLPELSNYKKTDDIENVFLEKIYLYEKAIFFISDLFKYFIKLRVSNNWNDKTVILINKWINAK